LKLFSLLSSTQLNSRYCTLPAVLLALLSPAISHRLRTNPSHAPPKKTTFFFSSQEKRERERERKIILLLLLYCPATDTKAGEGKGDEQLGVVR
jgi:hypothetical protein